MKRSTRKLPRIRTGEIMDKIDELSEMLRNSEGYMLGITTLKDGRLNHYFLTEKFHPLDMLKSLARVKLQVIESLEKGTEPEDDKDPK